MGGGSKFNTLVKAADYLMHPKPPASAPGGRHGRHGHRKGHHKVRRPAGCLAFDLECGCFYFGGCHVVNALTLHPSSSLFFIFSFFRQGKHGRRMFAPDKFEDPDVGVEGDDFAKARNFILAASKTVVTDDSGVPLKFFDREKWGVTAHGL